MVNDQATYVMLTDQKRYGMILKCIGMRQYEYDVSSKKWVRNGILLEYQCDSSPLYEMYKEISEEEAMRMIKN